MKNFYCPKCNKVMSFNRTCLTNDKAPTHQCSDPNCKFTQNRQTKVWEVGEWPTGAWFSNDPEVVKYIEQEKNKEQDKWNDLAFGKCKHAYLLEAFKHCVINNQEIKYDYYEKEAEKWAEMSMRRLNNPKQDIIQEVSNPQDELPTIQQDDDGEPEISLENIPF